MILADPSAIRLTSSAWRMYMNAIRGACLVLAAALRQYHATQDVDATTEMPHVGDEQFVALDDGRGKFVVEVSLGGCPLVTLFTELGCDDWAWASI